MSPQRVRTDEDRLQALQESIAAGPRCAFTRRAWVGARVRVPWRCNGGVVFHPGDAGTAYRRV